MLSLLSFGVSVARGFMASMVVVGMVAGAEATRDALSLAAADLFLPQRMSAELVHVAMVAYLVTPLVVASILLSPLLEPVVRLLRRESAESAGEVS